MPDILIDWLKHISCRFVCAVVVLLAAAGPTCALAADVAENRLLMGTSVEVRVAGMDRPRARAAIDLAYREMGRLAQLMNHYDPHSVVSAINRQAGKAPVAASPELLDVLEMAQDLARRTGGAFDVTIGALSAWRFDPEAPRLPAAAVIAAKRALVDYRQLSIDRKKGTVYLQRAGMRLDLGGIAKLYILDAGMRALQRQGVARAMINGGGDIVVIGGESDPWRIGIRHPRSDALAGVVPIANGFVVSSGDYERYFLLAGKRYHHILDPRTGYPTQGVQHVTVIGDELKAVNGISAAVMVLGARAGRALIERSPGLKAYIVADGGDVWHSPDFGLQKP